jgi:D-alanyl-lipoteichoic acid acyltransferase DltB (MBOAT superfamily)
MISGVKRACESTWRSCLWPIQVFTCILAITEVNMMCLAWVNFKRENKLQFITLFCKHLAKALIYNMYVEMDRAVESKEAT